jgi:CheY-like chemotaxis protein
MTDVLSIIFLEDNDDDAELIKRHLSKQGLKFAYRVVETRKDYIKAINEIKPTLILSDYSLPTFNGMQALEVRKDMVPNVPFVLITGSMNEDIAVECMKAGADDYVIKENMTRLVPAIKAAIEKQANIRHKKEAEKALVESERTFRNLYTNMNEGVSLYKLIFNNEGIATNYRVVSVNRQFEKIVNLVESNLVGKLATEIINNPLPFNVKEYRKVANEEKTLLFETSYEPMKKQLLISVSPWEVNGFAAIITDITAIRKAEDILNRDKN